MSEDILAASGSTFAELDLPTPEFTFTVGLARTHLELLEKAFTSQGAPELLAQVALEQGRVLLHAEGGAGKSTIAKRLLRAAAGRGELGALIDLRTWSPELLDEWEQLRGDAPGRAELLLDRLSAPRLSEEDLQALGGIPALIVLDGLNETPGPTAQSLLEVADGIAARHPQVGVLVTDRLLRRQLPSRHWRLAGIVDVASLASGADRPLLRGNAFFMSLAIREDMAASVGIQVLDEYLEHHVQLDSSELSSAAHAAADAYEKAGSRSFGWTRFAEVAGQEAFERLVASGILQVVGEKAIFRHHLFHDDLAARWLAFGDEARWGADTFATLTFGANSFDVLALALARIDETKRADRFVLSVYDYNYYGTAYALAEAIRLGGAKVDDDTRLAILAMLAERRFDSMRPTVDQVEDALRLFDDDVAKQMRNTESPEALLDTVAGIAVDDPHIAQWQGLFTAPIGSQAPDEAVSVLVDDDPLLGWTSANVLRRTNMTEQQLQRVWDAVSEDRRPVVRWRAAHALGHQPEPESVRRLQAATNDDNSLVRYGAVRSLVDLAFAHPGLRESILTELEEQAKRLANDPAPARELERSLQRIGADAEWISAISPLVEALWAKAPTTEQREHWRVVARAIGRTADVTA